MNDKFFSLPPEKQEAIINAGFRVFSQNSYRKSPMSEIADAASISKSLLFHYFHNKKELYLFLWNRMEEITLNELKGNGCFDQKDLFDTMYMGLQTKINIMRRYPDLGAFALKGYYENDPAVCTEIQKSLAKYAFYRSGAMPLNIDPEKFLPGLDLDMMYRNMFWASEGYIWESVQTGKMDVDKMEHDFLKLLDFWKSIYLRKGAQNTELPKPGNTDMEDNTLI